MALVSFDGQCANCVRRYRDEKHSTVLFCTTIDLTWNFNKCSNSKHSRSTSTISTSINTQLIALPTKSTPPPAAGPVRIRQHRQCPPAQTSKKRKAQSPSESSSGSDSTDNALLRRRRRKEKHKAPANPAQVVSGGYLPTYSLTPRLMIRKERSKVPRTIGKI
ncbi:uncharacterized protein H6S33_005592 [Morchella sextelata]|uniref:uncharacterized protein n=1 Tax=Morchella sextelata TaxID=1174677 RepID=UPI001D03F341|nr:uncharacterized protein H6S33_005592 [Morchella sextelata]KAH0613706.1 hypothetical protein H6S33_005592 [Morchella sextelata]